MGCGTSAPLLQPFSPLVAVQPHARLSPLGPGLRVIMIANPVSGGGEGRRTSTLVEAALREAGAHVQVCYTTHAGHAMEIASGISHRANTVICVVGGDGTAHEVVNGLAYGALFTSGGPPHLPPVLLVPCGSGNTVAFNLGIRNWRDSLAALAARRVFCSDVLELTRPEDAGVPRLQAPPPGFSIVSGAASADAGASGASGAGAGEATPAPPAPQQQLTPTALSSLKRRVVYSWNMTGWSLSTSIMRTANALRWMGGAQYNLAALRHIVANRSILGCVSFVDPPSPQPIPADVFQAARAELAAAEARRPGVVTGALTSADAAADEAAAAGAAMSAVPPAGAAGAAASAVTSGPSPSEAAPHEGAGAVPSAPASVSSAAAAVAAHAHAIAASDVSDVSDAPPAFVGEAIEAAAAPLPDPEAAAASAAAAAAAGQVTITTITMPAEGAGAGASAGSASHAGASASASASSAAPSPVPCLPSGGEAFPIMMLQLQPAAYIGSKMAFAPLSRMDDGMMDIVAVRHVSRGACIALMDAAKASGRHVLGAADAPAGRAAPLPGILYAQAREVIVRPLTAEETARWVGGDDVAVSSAASSAASSTDAASAAAGGLYPPVRITPSAAAAAAASGSDLASLRALRRQRASCRPVMTGMTGDDTLNIDGEIGGFCPVRVRVLSRVLPLIANPVRT